MTTPQLHAQTRTVIGKQVKQLRKQGLVPAVVYGHGTQATSIMFPVLEYEKLFRSAGTSTLVDLVIDGRETANRNPTSLYRRI
jgi:large subunit ribosomal protein L25